MGRLDGRTLVKDITLPSRGVLYGGLVPDGKVKVAGFKTQEEMIFSGGGQSVESRISHALENCLDCGDLSPNDLLVGDYTAALYWIRRLSYGRITKGRYGWETTCEECPQQFRVDIDLPGGLTLEEAEDDLEEPILVELPISKRQVGLRLLRRKDMLELSNLEDQRHRQSSDTPGDPVYYDRLARHVVTIDGAEPDAFSKKLEFVQSLEGPDSQEIRCTIDDSTPGYTTEVEARCPRCGFVSLVDMKMTNEFFRPRPRRDVSRRTRSRPAASPARVQPSGRAGDVGSGAGVSDSKSPRRGKKKKRRTSKA